MQARQVAFKFKGARNYIHGTDMFNAIITDPTGIALKNIRFTIHDFVNTPICQVFLSDNKDDLNNVHGICARCQYDENGITHWLALTEVDSDATLGGRYEYDEDRIVSLCALEQDKIILKEHSPFTFIETVVAMNKHMHQQLFPDASGRWIFTRIDLVTAINERDNLALQLKHNMNYRLTKSDILLNNNKVGDIYFSLVKS
jgi:hypothetical protein